MPDQNPAADSAAPSAGGMELTPAQAFEVERHSRLIDEIDDLETLRNFCRLLLRSWYAQKAATAWVIRQGMGR